MSEFHEFQRSKDPKRQNTCDRCYYRYDHWVHRVGAILKRGAIGDVSWRGSQAGQSRRYVK